MFNAKGKRDLNHGITVALLKVRCWHNGKADKRV